eukprot:CAMPEP_0115701330 /NCGR_PEP_ID=MMETSP0272-20121206/67900_1 /TAXON_ID=71861 /ORGANISM="Scrippsiella trochoidea, Strain CCMP3099" /LENGTH=178 /DNA_ID=CAMNT_0003141905 /DNA_START=102 /DNA_END=635 /DNA_ORIENTATION=-
MAFSRFAEWLTLELMPMDSKSSSADASSSAAWSRSRCRQALAGSKLGSSSDVTAVLLPPKSFFRSRLMATMLWPAMRAGALASSSAGTRSPFWMRSSLVGGPLLDQTGSFSEGKIHSLFFVCFEVQGPLGQKMLRFLGLLHSVGSRGVAGAAAAAMVAIGLAGPRPVRVGQGSRGSTL